MASGLLSLKPGLHSQAFSSAPLASGEKGPHHFPATLYFSGTLERRNRVHSDFGEKGSEVLCCHLLTH